MSKTMSETKPTRTNRIYMDTIRSELNAAIAANLFKEYDAAGKANYHYEISRAWKSKTSGTSGYSSKFYSGYAEAIAEVAEIADMAIRQAMKSQFSIGKKLTAKLGEKLSEAQLHAITVEKYRVLEEEFAHIKERGEDRFWQQVVEAVAEVKSAD